MHRASWIGLLAALVGLYSSTAPVRAAEADAPKTYVVLVGVSQYSDPQIKPRRHAESDAKALYDLFTDKTYLGAAQADVHLLLGTADEKRHSETATKANILKALGDVATKAHKNDLVLIALIGQGAPLGDRTCFLSSDATFKDRAKSAVASAEIETALKSLKSQKVCAIVDVNYKSYDSGKEVIPDPNLIDMVRVFVGNEDKEEHTLPPGRVVMLSNNSVSQPLELESQGLFTKLLIDGLKGAADQDGYEPDGVVTVDEIDAYIEKEMPKLARKIGKTSEEKEQAAFDWGARTNHYVLTHNPTALPKVEERLKKLDALKLAPEVEAEGRKLLTRMPKLKSEQDLRKAYQKLADGQLTTDAFLKLRQTNLAERKLGREEAEAYAARVLRGVQMVKDQYVKELSSGEMVGWAIRGLYRRLEEKVPGDVSERLQKVKDLRRADLESLLADVRERLGKREDLESNKDVDLSLQMMMTNLDPYTVYIDPEQKAKAEIDFGGKFTGIGIQIRRVAAKDALLVVTPIKGSPAYRAGLKAGDLITQIETDRDDKGHKLPAPKTFTTQGMKTETAVKHILGEAGTKVKVTVQREGASQPLDFELRRGLVEVETVLGAKRKDDDTWDFYIDPESKIGYIQLTQFTRSSFRDMEEAVRKLDKTGLKGLILDLRNDPGGLLSSAVQIADLFIDDGLIVTIRPRVGQPQPYVGEHEGSYLNFPMVCLVNNGSASGSEIVAACLQDHKRAVIVGERSYGKGSVQNIQPFPSTGGEIKLTTATFWRPSDKNLNKASIKDYEKLPKEELEKQDWGVRPDRGYVVKLDRKERFDLDMHLRNREIIPRRDGPAKPEYKEGEGPAKAEFKDRQLETALEYLHSQIKTASKVPSKKAG
jgi:carboxyl-terminal processing protease